MPFTAQLTQHYQRLDGDAFGTGGRVVAEQVGTIQLTGASAYHADVQTLSAGVSNRALGLAPLAASLPGSVLWLQANQPLDVRLNSLSGSQVCNVLRLAFARARCVQQDSDYHGAYRVAVLRLDLGGRVSASKCETSLEPTPPRAGASAADLGAGGVARLGRQLGLAGPPGARAAGASQHHHP